MTVSRPIKTSATGLPYQLSFGKGIQFGLNLMAEGVQIPVPGVGYIDRGREHLEAPRASTP